jgi:hypothetical protein
MPGDRKHGTRVGGPESSDVSRRSFLGRSLAGVAIASTGMLSACMQLAGQRSGGRQKATKAAAHYQNHPNKQQRCGGCDHYVFPLACGIVAGPISPHGWCRFYKARA